MAERSEVADWLCMVRGHECARAARVFYLLTL